MHNGRVQTSQDGYLTYLKNKLQESVRIINDIAKEFELVALTVAEPMLRLAIRLKRMLSEFPLI